MLFCIALIVVLEFKKGQPFDERAQTDRSNVVTVAAWLSSLFDGHTAAKIGGLQKINAGRIGVRRRRIPGGA